MKKIIVSMVMFCIIFSALVGCSNSKQLNSDGNNSGGSVAEDHSQIADDSGLKILISGKECTLPINVSFLYDQGYEMTFREENEASLIEAQGQIIYDIRFVNDSDPQQNNVESQEIYADCYCEEYGSVNKVMTRSIMVSNIDKEHFSINNFSIGDSIGDFIDAFGPEYMEIIGTVAENTKSEKLCLYYNIDNVAIKVSAFDGIIDKFWINV